MSTNSSGSSANDDPFDNDSGVDDVGSDFESETTSLSSTITDYVFENGRRYHAYKTGQYWGPNDERAQDNLDIAHHLFLMSLNGELYLAPITQKPERVLDIGTGTGIWAMDFADQHPATEVVGTDLSPIQPRWTPPNCKFEIDDANDDWTFAKNSFDFIHVRYLLGCISDWPRFYGQVMEHLKPGAYLEQVELSTNFKSEDDTVNPDNILGQSGPIFIEAAKTIGMSLTIIDEMKGYIEEAGFEDVVLKEYRWPVGTWSEDPKLKELGRWNQVHLLEGMEGFVLAWLTRIMGWQYEEVQVWLATMKAALRNKNNQYHAYLDMKLVYARKPSGRGKH